MNQVLSIKNSASVPVKDIPNLSYLEFADLMHTLLEKNTSHCVNYFCCLLDNVRRLVACIADDESHEIHIIGHIVPKGEDRLFSLSERIPALQLFERDIYERFGLQFVNHPWLKPVRFPSSSCYIPNGMDNYPFYSIEGEDLHEVGVGPVHAGIIEPGHFRFICNGETVLHLEIQLGYQHRGIEKMMSSGKTLLQQMLLAETIAGDTVIGHSIATVHIYEALLNANLPDNLLKERLIALELERVAMHLADSAALCADVGYQLGQVSCEALRTVVINGFQSWCGNRFGKGLIRPFNSDYPLDTSISKDLILNLENVKLRHADISHRIFSLPSVLDRFESIGKLSLFQVQQIGAVGMVAKSCGLMRDVRLSHPSSYYSRFNFEPILLDTGDIWARAMLRNLEIQQSISIILKILNKWEPEIHIQQSHFQPLPPQMMTISLVEGWRGEICHVAITDSTGEIEHYSIKDPSFHNWSALAMAMRNQEISDFPVCNKSFNLSYCGHDL